MLKRVEISADQVQQIIPIDDGIAVEVFKTLHGCYGNLFLSKYASGVLDDRGRDKGTASARKVWATKLEPYSAEVVGTALDRCQQQHPEYPPSLPQFLAICEAATPVVPFVAPRAIGMSDELRAEQAAAARLRRQQHIDAARARFDTPPIKVSGLDILKQCIASAAGAGGGDEAAELLRLDRMLSPAGAAA